MTPTPLFVYGTLLDGAVLVSLLGWIPPALPARLSGYRRLAVRGEHYPAILPDADSLVEGAILTALDDAALACLDAYEGTEYVRVRVPVEVSSQEVLAWAYIWGESPDRLEGEWAAQARMGSGGG